MVAPWYSAKSMPWCAVPQRGPKQDVIAAPGSGLTHAGFGAAAEAGAAEGAGVVLGEAEGVGAISAGGTRPARSARSAAAWRPVGSAIETGRISAEPTTYRSPPTAKPLTRSRPPMVTTRAVRRR